MKTNDRINDERVFVEMFNNHYINIVGKTSVLYQKVLEIPLCQKMMKKLYRQF